MNTGLNVSDPTVVAAFRSALAHQGIIALVILGLLSLAWVTVREMSPAARGAVTAGPSPAPEPAWRRLLRVGFGLLWVLDGILQVQPKMAVGLPSQVIQPVAASSPRWVQELVNWAGTSWSYHPIEAAAAAVWIQAGIGVWLLVANRGSLSRLAGLASVAWGLLVWVFGESFGGIFAPGLTWLMGAPGAALLYSVAGVLVALPARSWQAPRLGRWLLGGMGAFLAGMAVLQAWPGRGFWQGTGGTLAGLVQQMSAMPQPSFLARVVSGFASITAAHGFAVNLVSVIALALAGAAFAAAAAFPASRPALLRPAVTAFAVVCVADWVLIEDFGFFGGLGTDPNSMIPMTLLAIAGYLALTRLPSPAAEPAGREEPAAAQPQELAGATAAEVASPGPGSRWRELLRPAAIRRAVARTSLGTVVSVAAIAVIALGAIPMAAAQASPNASPILAQAIDGTSAAADFPAHAFTLIDQHGRQVSLASLRGKVVLLGFLDPVCVTDCPLEAQEFKQAGQLLGARASQVELVAVNLNPDYSQVDYLQAFDQQEGLDGVPDWLYLTGSPARLRQVFADYGIVSETLPGGAMLGHSDVAFVIDRAGDIRQELDFDPGPGTAATKSSFASELAGAASQTLASS
jgi:cytochrome oxidase Cu insertion factor (SCO1/SenC/PrrC family)